MINEYQTQQTLNPALWNSAGELKPGLRDGFMKIANHFYEFLEIPAEMFDIILVGSNANYNWTKHSDIDIHIIVNYLKIGDNLHLVENYLHAKKSIWNTNYPLTFHKMHIELYAQDSNASLHDSVGIYSLNRDEWIKKPTSDIITVDDTLISQKADPYEYEIDKLDSRDPNVENKIRDLLKRLKNLRQSGLDAAGEYSIENLAYKHLRNSGHLGRLKQLLHQTSIGHLNMETNVVEALNRHVSKTKLLDESEWVSIMKYTNAVEDPRGQWNHPGKCTMIPSNQITMQNVPHKVLGIDDTGFMKLMHPEKTYTYPGTRVFEIPHTPQWQTMIMQLINKLRNGTRYAK